MSLTVVSLDRATTGGERRRNRRRLTGNVFTTLFLHNVHPFLFTGKSIKNAGETDTSCREDVSVEY